MTVTASVLYDLVQCPQRVALDAFGDRAKRDEVSAFVRLLWERGTLFERETIAKLNQPSPTCRRRAIAIMNDSR
jgi:predicted RecB family nuclease